MRNPPLRELQNTSLNTRQPTFMQSNTPRKESFKSCLTREIISERLRVNYIVLWEIALSCSFPQSHDSLAVHKKPVDQAHLSLHVLL